jgi:hypothetical protein
MRSLAEVVAIAPSLILSAPSITSSIIIEIVAKTTTGVIPRVAPAIACAHKVGGQLGAGAPEELTRITSRLYAVFARIVTSICGLVAGVGRDIAKVAAGGVDAVISSVIAHITSGICAGRVVAGLVVSIAGIIAGWALPSWTDIVSEATVDDDTAPCHVVLLVLL